MSNLVNNLNNEMEQTSKMLMSSNMNMNNMSNMNMNNMTNMNNMNNNMNPMYIPNNIDNYDPGYNDEIPQINNDGQSNINIDDDEFDKHLPEFNTYKHLPKESIFDILIKNIKIPIFVLIIVFITFLPQINNILRGYILPYNFNNMTVLLLKSISISLLTYVSQFLL